MILVDTSIWVDHLRAGLHSLAELLDHAVVLGHPWVIGELALGHLANRQEVLELLGNLPQAEIATKAEVAALIEGHQLYGLGIGYVDVQLLAATALTPDARLWTDDKRLAAAALRLDLFTEPAASPGRT